ncbi:MAG: DUF3833 family protein [Pseudomonadota bacterium]
MDAFLLILLGAILVMGAVLVRRHYAEFYGQAPEDYEDVDPVFDLRQHLKGDMVCEGVIFGPMGRVTTTFAADFKITWDGDKGVMAERFRYSDGSTQDRCWHITLGDGGHFWTEAEDVPHGGRGRLSGHAVQMLYSIKLPETSGGHLLRTVDWMYLTPDGSIMNRSQFRKFGFKVAELVATIRPKTA